MVQVKIERPIMRIPMLAIHLYREIGEQGFKPNKQTHLAPILATVVKAAANKGSAAAAAESKAEAAPAGSEPNGDASPGDASSGNASGDPSDSGSKVCMLLWDVACCG